MSTCFTPTLDDLLADPLVNALMSADRVDAAKLRREMKLTAARLEKPGRVDMSGARVRFAVASKPGRAAFALGSDRAGGESWLCC